MPCISAGWAIRVGGVVERHRALEGVERSEDEGRGRGVAEGRPRAGASFAAAEGNTGERCCHCDR